MESLPDDLHRTSAAPDHGATAISLHLADAISINQQYAEKFLRRSVVDNEKGSRTTPQQMYLPGLDEWLRAMPNHLARSSLFAPVARGRKKLHNEVPIVTRADVVMTYTGEQLDEAQADVALQLLYEARKAPLGDPVAINRAAF
ncbi:plasmid replication initiator TrfA, partial [Noviherbaspirillum sp.]|uniref:plasmid replication initiator TrfA n=1 Tax=Noviherbaspirillum sp. TaxID=1926288 RepID=UPI002D33777F